MRDNTEDDPQAKVEQTSPSSAGQFNVPGATPPPAGKITQNNTSNPTDTSNNGNDATKVIMLLDAQYDYSPFAPQPNSGLLKQTDLLPMQHLLSSNVNVPVNFNNHSLLGMILDERNDFQNNTQSLPLVKHANYEYCQHPTISQDMDYDLLGEIFLSPQAQTNNLEVLERSKILEEIKPNQTLAPEGTNNTTAITTTPIASLSHTNSGEENRQSSLVQKLTAAAKATANNNTGVLDNTDNVSETTDDSNFTNTAVNIRPTLSLNGTQLNYATTFTENGGAIVLSQNLIFTDPNSVEFSAIITITNAKSGDELSATTSSFAGVNASFSVDTLTITNASSSNFSSILQSVSFNNTNPALDTTTRLIQWQISDGILSNTPLAQTTLSIVPQNNAPTFDTAGSISLPDIDEDDADPSGALLSSLVGNRISDSDTSAEDGIVIIAANNTNGTWQFKLPSGSWTDVGNVSDTSARALDIATSIRFKPAAHYNGTASIVVRAWDETDNVSSGDLTNASEVGGITAFSANSAAISIIVNSINDAPAFIGSSAINLNSINEDVTDPAGQTVSTLADSRISDADSGTTPGLAIFSAASSYGTWQYKLDSGSWTAIGSVAVTSALLLDASASLRFIPVANYNGAQTLNARAWDGETGSAGNTANISQNGGTTAFSDNSLIFSIAVDAVNDAPSFISSSVISLSGITEDQSNPTGNTVSALVSGSISDVDSGASDGLAIFSATSANGTWQYKLSGGTWAAIGSVSTSSALLLDASASLRFIPAADYNGAQTFLAHAWDGYTGSAGATGNVTSTGGSTAFSTNTKVFTISVSADNDAPVIIGSSPITLSAIDEDSTNPSGNTILSLVNTRISDVDSGANRGIAIFAADNTYGSWQYKLSAGSWTDIGSVSAGSALLLDTTASVRFIPTSHYNGTQTLVARAWDRTSGSIGGTADVSSNGDTSAFSAQSVVFSLAVNAINDPPAFIGATPISLSAIDEDASNPSGDTVSALVSGRITDPDSGAANGLAIISSLSVQGTWQYKLSGGSWTDMGFITPFNALLLDASASLRFVPNSNYNGTQTLVARAWDGTENSAGGSANLFSYYGGSSAFSSDTLVFNLAVSALNDAPDFIGSTPISLSGIDEDASNPSGDVVSALVAGRITDVDSGASDGLAIYSASSGIGTWQYKLSGGSWTDIGSVSNSSALLLNASASLRFVPATNENGTVTLLARAWDGASGAAGGNASVSSNGGTTAFSSSSLVFSLAVTAFNDAPVFIGSTAITLSGISEDASNPTGDVVSALVAGRITDVDSGASDGLAIYSASSGIGTWQYKLSGGTWADIGSVSSSSALLLNAAASLRFVPGANENGTVTLLARAWDGTSGSIGGNASVSSNGGTTAFSSSSLVFSLAVSSINDPPAFVGSTPISLTGINEDASNPTGDVVSALVAGRITDSDSGASDGLAIYAASSGIGTWQYQLSGGTWADIGSVSSSSALLLDATASLRFVPAANENGTVTLLARAWDGYTGSAGAAADITSNGGSSAFSTNTLAFSIGVAAINDAPDFIGATAISLSGISEDASNPSGDVVSALVVGRITDVDSGASDGLAIYSASSGIGTWQYKLSGGTWSAIGSVSSSSALLLDATASLRFVPGANENGTVTLLARAWDGYTGSAGANASVTSNGGSTAFSSSSLVFSLAISSINDPPSFVGSTAISLTGINEDASNPSGDVVSALVAGRITDNDSGANDGLAIYAASSGIGTWQYKLSGGTWTDIGSVSSSSALLLNASASLRFVPAAEQNGNATLLARAWDGTSGSAGGAANITSNGGSSAFSTNTLAFSIAVASINDAPDFIGTTAISLSGITEDASNPTGDVVSALVSGRITDVDSGDGDGLAIYSASSGIGTWQYKLSGGTWVDIGSVSSSSALLLNASASLRFVPGANQNGTVTLLARAWDGYTGSAGGNASVTSNGGSTAFSTSSLVFSLAVSAENDAPAFTGASVIALTAMDEDESAPSGETVSAIVSGRVSDADSGTDVGIAIYSLSNSNGTWQYKLSGGSWTTISSVSSTAALLLDVSSTLRFIPTANYNGTETFIAHAWDESSGTAGTTANITSNGGSTAFSSNSEVFSLTINDVNDAPGITGSGTISLTTVTEDDSNPSGDLVSSLISSRVSDADSGDDQGIAIFSAGNSNGTWQFKLSGGSWTDVGSVSNSSARLIDSSASLRFKPATDYFGTDETIQFRLWDQDPSGGSNGALAAVSTNGGATAYSSNTGVMGVEVVDVVDVQIGDESNNTLTGDAGMDLIYGEGGDDILSGLAGADTLVGGHGSDFLFGGDGDDLLYADNQTFTNSTLSNLQGWFAADDLYGQTSVSTWSDKSGNSNDATQDDSDKTPTVSTNTISGVVHDSIYFDGSNDYLKAYDLASVGGAAYSMFIVMNPGDSEEINGQQFLGFHGDDGTNRSLFNVLTTGEIDYHQDPNSYGNQTLSGDYENYGSFALAMIHSGSSITMALNGDSTPGVDAATVQSLSVTPDRFTIGQDWDGATTESNFFVGDMFEILIFDTALSADAQLTVNEYLAFRYGLSLDSESHGQDELTGGDGADTFIWTNASHSGFTSNTRDIITDFVSGTDFIDINGIISSAKSFVVAGETSFSNVANEIIWTSSGTDTIISIDFDGNGVTDWDIELADASTPPDLAATDFIFTNAVGTDADDSLRTHSDGGTLDGKRGDDTLTGYAGNDTLIGGYGSDTLVGGAGDDTLYADNTVYLPTDTDNLQLWLSASDINGDYTNTTGNVVTWVNKAGSTVGSVTQATSSARPTYSSSAANGRGGLSFDGTDDYLSIDYDSLLNGTDMSVFVIAERTVDDGTFGAAVSSRSDTTGGKGYIFYESDDDDWEIWYGDGVTTWNKTGSETVVLNQAKILSLTTTGTAGTSYFDGGTGISTSAGDYLVNPDAPFKIGAGEDPNNDFFLYGNVSEVIVFNTELSSSQLEVMHEYLAMKYGIALSGTTLGSDTLTGGDGSDTFVWTDASISTSSNRDNITDFNYLEDKISLQFEDMLYLQGFSSSESFGTGQRGELIANDDGTDTLVQIDWGGDASADFEIELSDFGDADNLDSAKFIFHNVTGTDAGNTLTGGELDDTMIGKAGDDTLTGNAGADTLVGGHGSDTISGGAGADIIYADNKHFISTSIDAMQLWLDASDSSSVSLSGSDVTDWNDLSGADNHATQSTSSQRPSYTTSSINGISYNALYFDGVDEFLSANDLATHANGDFSFYIMFDPISTFRGTFFAFNSSGGGNSNFFSTDASYISFFNDSQNEYLADDADYVTGGALHFGMVNSSDVGTGYVNGTVDETASMTTSSATTFSIGQEYDGGSESDFFYGHIYELLFFNTALDATEQAIIDEYYSLKYGTDLNGNSVGADVLTGGTGADTFIWTNASHSGISDSTRDRITDFSGALDGTGTSTAGDGDIIDLLGYIGIGASYTVTGLSSTFSNTTNEVIWYQDTSLGNTDDTIVSIDKNADGVADFEIRLDAFTASDLASGDLNVENDAASIAGTTTGSVTEDSSLTASGTLTITDADSGHDSFRADESISGSYGTLAISSDGTWNYLLDNSNATVQAIPEGGTLTDVVTVTAFDGTTQDITITINSSNSFSLVSNASDLGSGEYQLTPNSSSQKGAIWDVVDLSVSFTLTAEIYLGATDGADGMAFTIHNQGTSAIGSPGGSLGSDGITNAVGIAIDTYDGGDYMQFYRYGIVEGSGLDLTSTSDLEDNAYHDLTITWNATTSTLSYDLDSGATTDSYTYTNLVSSDFSGDSTVYLGFTAATGGITNLHKVRNISFAYAAPPIVLDLDDDGLEYSSKQVLFDMDNDGIKELTQWVNADDGFLTYDKNEDGLITDTDEISFISYLIGAQTDLEGLRAFDSNQDGYLDSGDEFWHRFNVWQDADQDGITDNGELVDLDSAGLSRIHLQSDGVARDPAQGVHEYGQGVFERNDGSQGTFADVGLSYQEQSGGLFSQYQAEHSLNDNGELVISGIGTTLDLGVLGQDYGELSKVVLSEDGSSGISISLDDLLTYASDEFFVDGDNDDHVVLTGAQTWQAQDTVTMGDVSYHHYQWQDAQFYVQEGVNIF